VENDPGDNALEVQGVRGGRLSPKAYARLASGWPGYELVLVNPPDAQPWTFRIAKVIQERLLLGRLIWSRAALLHFGIALQLDDRDVQMTTRAGAVPRENDLPSSWPAPYRKRAEELGRRILSVWAATARTERRHFVMLYVPRGEDQLRGRLAPTDTWLPWLTATAKALDIPLIDPSNALARRMESGEAVYDDHWSPAGHEVVAGVLSDYLARWAKERER
jgi:hypothetical protein